MNKQKKFKTSFTTVLSTASVTQNGLARSSFRRNVHHQYRTDDENQKAAPSSPETKEATRVTSSPGIRYVWWKLAWTVVQMKIFAFSYTSSPIQRYCHGCFDVRNYNYSDGISSTGDKRCRRTRPRCSKCAILIHTFYAARSTLFSVFYEGSVLCAE